MVSFLLPWKITSDRYTDFLSMQLAVFTCIYFFSSTKVILCLQFIEEVAAWQKKNLTTLGKSVEKSYKSLGSYLKALKNINTSCIQVTWKHHCVPDSEWITMTDYISTIFELSAIQIHKFTENLWSPEITKTSK